MAAARKNYEAFMADGIDQGSRPELVGGGLLRSRAGSLPGSAIFADERMASDERILGEGDFVAAVLQEAEAHMTARQRYQMAGFGLDQLATLVAELLEIEPAQVRPPANSPNGSGHGVCAAIGQCGNWDIRPPLLVGVGHQSTCGELVGAPG